MLRRRLGEAPAVSHRKNYRPWVNAEVLRVPRCSEFIDLSIDRWHDQCRYADLSNEPSLWHKGHAAIDPDSEIITETVVTPGNAGDASVAEELIADLLADTQSTGDTSNGEGSEDLVDGDEVGANERPTVYGDNAYGTGGFQERLENEGIESRSKTQRPTAAPGLFTKDRFDVDVAEGAVTCPNGVTVVISRHRKGGGMAYFRDACTTCALRPQCTTAAGGRTIFIGAQEEALARARLRQVDPAWRHDYRTTRPKVERKLAHLMRRRHGGRRARVRGTTRIDADFKLLAAAVNLARLGTLGMRSSALGWTLASR
jgi:hypothetical protein